jgi:TRAP-type C4-dicarboxylate transport system permease large subunit
MSATSLVLLIVLFFVTSAVGRVPLWPVAREVLPFLGWSLVVLTLVTAFPQLSTWLPNLAFR